MLSLLASKRLALFDMDGVLYDSMSLHAIAWVQAMASFDIHFKKEDAYLSEGEKGVDTVRRYFFRQFGEEVGLERATEMYKHKARLFQTLGEARLMPGIMEVMNEFKLCGFTIGVVTGSGQKVLLERILHDFNGFVSPGHIVCAFDVSHGKPDPEPYLVGMKKCGDFSPEETVVIENAPLGVRSAHASGAYTIAVNTGPLPDEALLSEGADQLFPDMKTFSEYLHIKRQ